MKGKISEVFDSLQGEGIYLGEKQLFVRFFGCNLNCKFCDTRLDYFTEYTPDELFSEIKLYDGQYHYVSFTGGEPLLQKDFLKDILRMTSREGYINYLETNGTLPAELDEVIGYVDIVAMDLKLPSSTGLSPFWGEHRQFLNIASKKEVFLKAVICASTQEVDVVEGLNLIKEVNKSAILVLQPNSYEDYAQVQDKLEHFRNIARDNRITACIIPQMHRRIGIK